MVEKEGVPTPHGKTEGVCFYIKYGNVDIIESRVL